MFKKRASFWLAMMLVVSLLTLSFACGGKKDEGTDNTGGGSDTAKAWTPKGDEGTITGKINLTGTAPAPQPIDMSQDANCKAKNPNATTETVVAKDGKLADGSKIGDYSFKTPDTEAVIDQNGCHYVPHVLGMQVNQKLKITNSDPTGHNIHALPKSNEEWNDSQPAGSPPITNRTFKRSEILVPVKCNQHPWMKAWIGVVKHPFFAVSKDDGSFEIKGVPPGTYTVVAWHEKFGEKTATVKVDAKGTATSDFSFDAGASASLESSSLEVMPAMDVPMLMKH